MKQGLTEIVYILDRSGSMAGLEEDTIGGFNAMLKEQQGKEGEALLSTVLFDSEATVVHDRIPIERAEPLDRTVYRVGGCTALLDALGGAIHHIRTIHKYGRQEDRPEKTLFLIMTDGLENSSRKYSFGEVRKLVEQQKAEAGWEFLFLGANMDAVSTASRFGLGDRNHAVSYESDAAGTALNHRVMNQFVSAARKASSSEELHEVFMDASMLEPIREDYQKRHRK